MPQPDPPPALRRLSSKQRLVLDLLATSGESYGLQLVRASEGGLKRGTVYVTLGRMEEKALVESREERPPLPRSGMPRRLYRPTALGLRTLRATEAAEAAWAAAGGHA